MSQDTLKAEHLAVKVHAGQRVTQGQSYTGHLERVADHAERRALHAVSDGINIEPDEVAQAGWLHDIIENTETTVDDLRDHGFCERVIEMVQILTKPSVPMAHSGRIQRIIDSGNLGAILIKLSEAEDNNAHLGTKSGSVYPSRYTTAIPLLKTAAANLGYTGA